MSKTTTFIFALALAIGAAGAASAKPCRDPHGRFMRCPAAAPPVHCRNIHNKKFAKCGLPDSEPVPMRH